MGGSNGKMKKPVNLRKSVKSFYVIEAIFSLLSEKKKLNLIIYNKKYQRILGFNIDYYKLISGKEIIDLKKGKGKELKLYFIKIIIFKYI